MYALMLSRTFKARHFLVGNDWGPENEPHAHAYRVEARLAAETLDRHGYVIDLEALEKHLDRAVEHFRDRLLNEMPEFRGINPSIEHLSRRLFDLMVSGMDRHRLASIEIRIWESDDAWASYRE
ncbi:MAG: 6-pyruvoyl trahydropterin synthase family protein [Desulfobacterales bacterium]